MTEIDSKYDDFYRNRNPVSQPGFAQHFTREGRAVVRWDEFVRS